MQQLTLMSLNVNFINKLVWLNSPTIDCNECTSHPYTNTHEYATDKYHVHDWKRDIICKHAINIPLLRHYTEIIVCVWPNFFLFVAAFRLHDILRMPAPIVFKIMSAINDGHVIMQQEIDRPSEWW